MDLKSVISAYLLLANKWRSLTECNIVLTKSVSNSFGSKIHFRSNSSVFNFAQKFSEFHVYILNRFLPHLIRNFSRNVSTKLKPVSWAFEHNFKTARVRLLNKTFKIFGRNARLSKIKQLDNKSLIRHIMCVVSLYIFTRYLYFDSPLGLPKYCVTRKNIQRYYTLNCLIGYMNLTILYIAFSRDTSIIGLLHLISAPSPPVEEWSFLVFHSHP